MVARIRSIDLLVICTIVITTIFLYSFLSNRQGESLISLKTNFKALTSASGSTSHKEWLKKVQAQQKNFCKDMFPYNVPDAFKGSVMNFVPLSTKGYGKGPQMDINGMYVLGDNDVVSHHLTVDGFWEKGEIMIVLEALESASEYGIADPLFVDIGANLGTFSILALAYGFRAYAFEAMQSNGAHFRSTLCQTPRLMEKAYFFEMGLGSQPGECVAFSHEKNAADGFVRCDVDSVMGFRFVPRQGDLSLRHFLDVQRLDSLVDEDIWVIKIDVEGFEHQVFLGAKNIFKTRKVYYIVTEINTFVQLSQDDTRKFLSFFRQNGFTCYYDKFHGTKQVPIASTPENIEVKEGTYNIFCHHSAHLAALGKH